MHKGARRREGGKVRLATRRRKVRVLVFSVCLVMVVGGVCALSALSYNERLAIADVQVSGAEKLSPDTLKAAAESVVYDGDYHVFSGANIFLYPKTAIEEQLRREFPRIHTVSVSRESLFANAVTVLVQERIAYAVWCKDGACYAMDTKGFVFDGSVPSTTSGYIFRGGLNSSADIIGQTFLPGHLPEVVAVLDLLKERSLVPLGVRVENETDYTIAMAGGYDVFVSFGQDASSLVKSLELMLSSEALKGRSHQLAYVDLRFDGRGFYKLKGE